MKEISPTEAAVLLDTHSSMRLIDCREEDEYAICYIERAELMPLSSWPSLVHEKLPDKDQTILIYCHHGMRSMSAVETLTRMGYTDVYNLSGGIDRWTVEIDPEMNRY